MTRLLVQVNQCSQNVAKGKQGPNQIFTYSVSFYFSLTKYVCIFAVAFHAQKIDKTISCTLLTPISSIKGLRYTFLLEFPVIELTQINYENDNGKFVSEISNQIQSKKILSPVFSLDSVNPLFENLYTVTIQQIQDARVKVQCRSCFIQMTKLWRINKDVLCFSWTQRTVDHPALS